MANLPLGYQEVEYLVCYGYQYINYPINLYANDIIDCAAALASSAPASETGFFGYPSNIELYFESGKVYDWGGKISLISPSSGSSISRETKIVMKATITKDIGTGFYWGCYRTNQYRFYGNIYELTLTRNDNVLVHIVPCYRISDDKPGFYDIVNGNFFVNDGSGEFGLGPEVSPSYYIVRFNDGEGNTETQKIIVGVSTALNSPFAKRGYTLIGWDTAQAGITVVYTPGQIVADIAQGGETLDLYAVWEKAWGYLIKDSSNNYYTAVQLETSQSLVPLSGIITLNKTVFLADGFQFKPNSAILKTLTNPTVYLWQNESQATLLAVVDAIPYPQEIKTQINFNVTGLSGIESIAATYSGNINVQYSYDDTTYTTAVDIASFLALDVDTLYNGLGSSKQLYIKFILLDADALLTQFILTDKRSS